METIPALLSENPRGLLTIQDELTSFMRGMNQFKGGKGNDRSTVLKIWSGDAIKKDRVGHENRIPIIVPHPFLSIVGGIPPDMLHEMAHARGCSDGFLDRFLFAYPDSNPVPEWSEEGVPDEAIEEWGEIVGRLWDRPLVAKDGKLVSHVAQFTLPAKALWVSAYNDHVGEMNSEGFARDLRSPWGKFREYAGRLTLVLACLRHAADPTEDAAAIPEVRVEDVRGASQLVRYFKNHALRVRAVLTHGDALRGGSAGKTIFDWLKGTGGAAFSERDVKQARRSLDPRDVAEALKALETSHVIRRREMPGPTPKGGRPPSPIFDVNPAILDTQNTQNPQNHDYEGGFEGSECSEEAGEAA